MSSQTRLETLVDPAGLTPTMTLQVPESWVTLPPPEQIPIIATFADPDTLSSPTPTTLVVTSVRLPPGAQLEVWQNSVDAAHQRSLPGITILGSRRLQAGDAPDDTQDRWLSSSTMTDQNGNAVLTHRWSRLSGSTGLLLTATIAADDDRSDTESDVLAGIAESWVLEGTAG